MQKIFKTGNYFVGNFLGILRLNSEFYQENFEFENCFFINENFQNQFILHNGLLIKNVAFMNCTFGQNPKFLKDNEGFKYKNEDAVIGIIPEFVIEQKDKINSFGRIISFKSDFEVNIVGSEILFSNIKIDTGNIRG